MTARGGKDRSTAAPVKVLGLEETQRDKTEIYMLMRWSGMVIKIFAYFLLNF